MDAITQLFRQIFLRAPLKQELVVLQRLLSAYGQAILCDAIRSSIIVEGNSPINYIAKVCENLYNNNPGEINVFNALRSTTQRRLQEMERYEIAG